LERIALNHALRRGLGALSRFPLVFAAGVIGAVSALALNHLPIGANDARIAAGDLAMTAWLGVPLLFALAAVAESRRFPAWAALGLQGAGVASLIAYHRLLSASPWPVRISRFWLCMLAAHLLASLATGLGPGATAEGFWRYNQRLAARFGLSLGYCALMHLGLGLGLASIKGLFELDFPDAWFLDPGILALGVFNTWFFLAGVPRLAPEPAAKPATSVAAAAASGPAVSAAAADGVPAPAASAAEAGEVPLAAPEVPAAVAVEAAKADAAGTVPAPAEPAAPAVAGGGLLAYPRQLRVLVQLILIPLVCVYLGIIYAYGVRILMLGRWPTGWVTWLLLGFCALALLCLFLAQPLADRGGNRWLALYCRHFHVALVPVLILLFFAIGKRVQEYGLTENRYFALALGVWLSGIVLHAALDAPRDLRLLPGSLCLAALMAAFGPWGAFEVSRKSQEARLKGLLETNGMLVGGKLAKAPGRVPRLAVREIGGIAGFLEERERLSDLKPWIPAIDDSGQTNSVAWHKALDGRFGLLEALELPYMPPEATGPGRAEAVAFNCRGLAAPLRKVSGFDYLIADFRAGAGAPAPEEEDAQPAEGSGFRFAFDSAAGVLRFRGGGKDSGGLALDLGAHFQKLRRRYPDAYDLNLPPEEMQLEAEDGELKVLARLRNMDGLADGEGARLKGFAADLFVAVKGKARARGRTASLAQAANSAP
jgi:hypothetical protein